MAELSAPGFDLLPKTRVAVFVDGFNLFHALEEFDVDPATRKRGRTKNHLKWLSLWKVAEAVTHRDREQVVAVHYFTAYADWLDAEPKQRHRHYVKALRSTGVTVHFGKFKCRTENCRKCGSRWDSHEEKRSDVNLALAVVFEAVQNHYDKALVLTGDTDIVPAIQMVRNAPFHKTVTALIPKRRKANSNELQQAANATVSLTEAVVGKCLFPEHIHADDGSVIVARPLAYAPPQ